jgi:O-antigen ligase
VLSRQSAGASADGSGASHLPGAEAYLSFAAHAAIVWVLLALLPGSHESFESVKAMGARALGSAGLVFVLARGRPRRWPLHPLDVAMTLWFAVECAATGASVSPMLSVFGELESHDGLLTSVGLAGIYALVRVSCASERSANSLLLTVELACTLAFAYALAQSLGGDPLRWNRQFGYPTPWGSVERAFGTLGSPTLLAIIAATAAVLGLERCIAASQVSRPRWLFLLLAATVLVGTLSRGGWLAVAAGIVSLVALTRPRLDALKRIAVPLALIGTTISVMITFVWPRWGSAVLARGHELAGAPSRSGFERAEMWETLIRGWLARPVAGYGPDTVGLMFQRFQRPEYWRMEWASVPAHGHSAFLHVLFTRGLFGILALVVLLMAVLWTLSRGGAIGSDATRARMRPSVAMLVTLGVASAFNMLGIAGAVLAVVSLALLACAHPHAEAAVQPVRESNWPPILAALVLCAMLVGGVAESRGMRSLWVARRAFERAADSSGDNADKLFRLSEAHARRAARFLPGSDLPFRQMAQALLSEAGGPDAVCEQTRQAVVDARHAVDLAPLRAANQACLARALAGMGACSDSAWDDAAHVAVMRAVELAPANALIMTDCARTELTIGRPEEALRLGGRVVELYPSVAWGYSVRAAAMIVLGRPADATLELEQALSRDWEEDMVMRAAAQSTLSRLRAARAPNE